MTSFHSPTAFKFVILFGLFLFIPNTFGQQFQTISVLFINEIENDEANVAMKAVLSYIIDNQFLGITLDLKRVYGNRSKPNEFLQNLCAVYSEFVEYGDPPHLVLDTTRTPVISEITKAFTASLGLPTVSGSFGDIHQWRNITDKKRQYLLQVMPPNDIIPEVIRSIIDHAQLANVVILFDKTFVMNHKYKSLKSSIPAKSIIIEIDEIINKEDTFRLLYKMNITNFLILGSLHKIQDIFDKVIIDTAKNDYYIITQDLGNFTQCCRDINVVMLRPKYNPSAGIEYVGLMNKNTKTKHISMASVFYFNLALRALQTIKKMISTNKWPEVMQYSTCENYIASNSPDQSIDLRSFCATAEIDTFGKFEFASQNIPFNGHSRMLFDMEILAVTSGYKLYSENTLGSWVSGFKSPLILLPNRTLRGLKGTPVYKIGVVEQPPFIIKDNNAKNKCRGLSIDLLDKLADMLNFKYIIVFFAEYGQMDDNGEWNGVVRDLMEKDLDMGLGAMHVMADRQRVIDFTIPYYDLVGLSVLMILPSTKNSLFKFLTVLETDVWFCILGAYFFTSFLMYIFDRWSPYSYQNNREKYADDDEKKEFTMRECLWFCITSLTPQGAGEAPKNLSGRLVAGTWWLFGFIVIASYTANLAAFLTVSRLETPIESLDDLSKQYKVMYGSINGSTAMKYFERMSEIEGRFYEIWKEISLNDSLSPVERSKLAVWDYPVSCKYTKIWQAMQEAQLPKTLQEAIRRVRNSTSTNGFALIGDAAVNQYLQLTNCDLQIIGEEFSRKPYAIAVQQGSPLKDLINSGLQKLLDVNYIEKLKKQWWKKSVVCSKIEDQQDGISVSNIGGVFIVIFVGIGCAFIALIIEFWWFKYRQTAMKMIAFFKSVKNRFDVPILNVCKKTNLSAQESVQSINIRPANERFPSAATSHNEIEITHA